MTSPEGLNFGGNTGIPGKGDRAAPIRLQMRRSDAGTLLGALAWVLGAMQIMRDRGHAEQDEEFHELYDRVAPKIEHLVEQLNQARTSTMTEPRFEEPIEEAYAEVRAAFETWIQLTATDTLSMAVATRLEGIAKEAEESRGEGEAE